MDKKCKKCDRMRPIEEYQTALGKNKYGKCIECRREVGRKRMQKKQVHNPALVHDHVLAGLGAACLKCGYNDSTEVLELHHLTDEDGGRKLSHLISSYAYSGKQAQWDALYAELHKCIPLCPTCRKALRLGVWKDAAKLAAKSSGPVNLRILTV